MTSRKRFRERVTVAVRGFAFSVWCLPLSPVVPHAQPTVPELRAPTCAECRIEVKRLFSLDNGPDNALLDDFPFAMAMDSHGRIALAVRGGKGVPLVYDPTGRSPQRVGRRGSGPNEYTLAIGVAFDAGDTLNVFDIKSGRRTELLNNQLIRTNPYTSRSALMRLAPDRRVLVSTYGGDRFALFNDAGQQVRSFGPLVPMPGGARAATTLVSNVVANQFWSVNTETYALEQWTLDGRRIAQLQRAAEWFKFRRPIADGSLGTEPTSAVADLRVDKQNRLWVLINVPNANWRNALGPATNKRGFTSYPNKDDGKLYDTFVEVIDINTHRLLQSVRVAGYLRFLVSDTHLASWRQDEEGSPVVDMWRFQLVPPQQRRLK